MATKKSTKTGSSGAIQSSQQPLISSRGTIARRRANIQRVQNVLLVWLDNNIDNNTDDCQNTITQLRRVVNEINTFTDDDQCVHFIEATEDNKVCMIISGALGQHIVPRVHGMSQVDSIFIFCGNKKRHEAWAKDWTKIKGVFTDIGPICEALKQASKQCEQDAMPISFVTTSAGASNKKLDELEPSFMYTEILKKILFTIEFEPKHFTEFIAHCRLQFAENDVELKNIKKIEKNYRDRTPIWWYTCECFLYPMLNLGLRTMDGDIIIKMGFFTNDLHRQIQELHSEQFGGHLGEKDFTVYRGQGLPISSFEQMKNTQGGLMSFNNFLSTSKERDVSMGFARNALTKPDSVGVLFIMTINPAQSTTPFASINDVGYFGDDEDEVLFSMHSVFRIGGIQPMSENARLFQVNLTLTSDNDQDLRQLTDRIEEETAPEEKGWYRLGSLLRKMGQPKKAEEVYLILLEQCDDESERGRIYHRIGMIKYDQGEYPEAIEFYEKAVEIYKKTLPPNHLSLAASYNNMGLVHDSMGDYPKALSSHEKALAIRQQSLPSNHPDLASSYNNIGLVHDSMGDYPKALSSHEKALAIRQQSLSPNHPDLAASYNNIGTVHSKMDDNPKALSFYEKALAILKQSLPPNHPDLAASYNNIGSVHSNMGDYRKARSNYERAVAIGEQSLPPNHPNLQQWKGNLDRIKTKL